MRWLTGSVSHLGALWPKMAARVRNASTLGGGGCVATRLSKMSRTAKFCNTDATKRSAVLIVWPKNFLVIGAGSNTG